MLAEALRKQFTPEATVVESPLISPGGAHFQIELDASVGTLNTNHTSFNQMKAVTLISCALQPLSRAGLFRPL